MVILVAVFDGRLLENGCVSSKSDTIFEENACDFTLYPTVAIGFRPFSQWKKSVDSGIINCDEYNICAVLHDEQDARRLRVLRRVVQKLVMQAEWRRLMRTRH
jgi:hypothetical protein